MRCDDGFDVDIAFHILTLTLADIIRRSSGGNLGIRAGLEQGHKWFFNRNGS